MKHVDSMTLYRTPNHFLIDPEELRDSMLDDIVEASSRIDAIEKKITGHLTEGANPRTRHKIDTLLELKAQDTAVILYIIQKGNITKGGIFNRISSNNNLSPALNIENQLTIEEKQ